MKNILIRTLTGSVYVALIIVSLLLHPIFFGLITVILNYISLREFSRIYSELGVKTTGKWVIINSVFFLLSVLIISMDMQPGYVIIPVVLLFLIIPVSALYTRNGNPSYIMAVTMFGSIYITLPLILLNLIQQISLQTNIPFTLAIFVIIWTNDTFAYLVGLAIGRNRIFERISPKKSWEGFFGGLVMGILASLVIYYLYPDPGLINWVTIGFLTIIACIFGDFVESSLKRTAAVKDSGTIMPGHGGILDRADSLLFVSPIIYIILMIIIK
ncbi:MAG: phosphatidate cytidylyltransferase [Bacteroidales bacterium]|nr:phosphatidate cytidylyltransferase [Bacteroidales bacterium]